MTDIEKFIELYRSVGVDLKKQEYQGEYFIVIEVDEKLIEGHIGVLTIINFDKNGKFVKQEICE